MVSPSTRRSTRRHAHEVNATAEDGRRRTRQASRQDREHSPAPGRRRRIPRQPVDENLEPPSAQMPRSDPQYHHGQVAFRAAPQQPVPRQPHFVFYASPHGLYYTICTVCSLIILAADPGESDRAMRQEHSVESESHGQQNERSRRNHSRRSRPCQEGQVTGT